MSHCTTKPTKWLVRQAKTRISLGIPPVWWESSPSAWRNLGFLAIHWAHSEAWSDWADAQTDLGFHWSHRSFCWFCHAAAQMHQFKTCCPSLYLDRRYYSLPEANSSSIFHTRSRLMKLHGYASSPELLLFPYVVSSRFNLSYFILVLNTDKIISL